ncbi:MAG: hypothetical protein ACK6D3_15515 [Planctomycetaceae bacterium]
MLEARGSSVASVLRFFEDVEAGSMDRAASKREPQSMTDLRKVDSEDDEPLARRYHEAAQATREIVAELNRLLMLAVLATPGSSVFGKREQQVWWALENSRFLSPDRIERSFRQSHSGVEAAAVRDKAIDVLLKGIRNGKCYALYKKYIDVGIRNAHQALKRWDSKLTFSGSVTEHELSKRTTDQEEDLSEPELFKTYWVKYIRYFAPSLTALDHELIQMLMENKTQRIIASELVVSESRVSQLIKNLELKLGVPGLRKLFQTKTNAPEVWQPTGRASGSRSTAESQVSVRQQAIERVEEILREYPQRLVLLQRIRDSREVTIEEVSKELHLNIDELRMELSELHTMYVVLAKALDNTE